jgi:hypothetical protein
MNESIPPKLQLKVVKSVLPVVKQLCEKLEQRERDLQHQTWSPRGSFCDSLEDEEDPEGAAAVVRMRIRKLGLGFTIICFVYATE